MPQRLREIIAQSIQVKTDMLADARLLAVIDTVAGRCVRAFSEGKKLLFCGNGGSAADAQHMAAELSGRFRLDRPPLFAEALHVNSSFLTAVANDYGYEQVFARMIQASGREGDVLIAISTSGNSPSILVAAQAASSQGMTVVGMTGASGGKLAEHCHLLLNMPSDSTPRIQEAHILVGHILCELIEERLFGGQEDG
jgi:D-sedoheptulose 7-phosphate isomerase